MSRAPRVISENGMYHICFRSMSGLRMFEDREDLEKFRSFLAELKKEFSLTLYTYALTDEYVHLFVKEHSVGDISTFMHRLLTRYVVWFNYKYSRLGSLVANRYKSEPVSEDKMLQVMRYIHQSADRSTSHFAVYASGYGEFFGEKDLCDTALLESHFSTKEDFVLFHNTVETADMKIGDGCRESGEVLKARLKAILGDTDIMSIGSFPIDKRDEIIKSLRVEYGYTIGQLQRLTGLSRGIVTRATVEKKATRPYKKRKTVKEKAPSAEKSNIKADNIAEETILTIKEPAAHLISEPAAQTSKQEAQISSAEDVFAKIQEQLRLQAEKEAALENGTPYESYSNKKKDDFIIL